MGENAYEFGPYRLDPRKRVLACEGRPIGLTPKALDVLLVLVENRDRALDKDELLRTVWPDTFVEENNLVRNISSLRKALGARAGDHDYVVTIPGKGYRFVAPVREVALPEPPTGGEEPAPGGGLPESAAPPGRSRPAVLVLAAVLGLAVAGAGWHAWGRRAPATQLRALAVLPFDNLSAPDQDYLADGMTDVLITELTAIRFLRVISRQSVIRYRKSEEPLPRIAGALGVDALVEGTAVRDGNRVRVTARLVHAAAERQLWAGTFERDAADVLGMQSEIARAIAREVRATVTDSEQARLARPATRDAQAYDAYLRGRHFYNRRYVDGEEALLKSVRYLEEATARDPGFAAAHASLSFAYGSIAYRGIRPPWEASPRQDEHARRAVELDPQLVDAHTALAASLAWNHWDWTAAEAAFRRAVALNPGDAHARLSYSFFLLHLGRLEESLAQTVEGLRLDPFNVTQRENQVGALVGLGRIEEAVQRQREIAEIDPNAGVDGLGWLYFEAGRTDEALAEFERVGSPRGIAYARALKGDAALVRAMLRELSEREQQRYVSPIEFVRLHAVLGENDLAFARLEEAYRTRAPALAGLKWSPRYAPLRPDPRFAEMVRRLKLD